VVANYAMADQVSNVLTAKNSVSGDYLDLTFFKKMINKLVVLRSHLSKESVSNLF
jgi:hypothetical protein